MSTYRGLKWALLSVLIMAAFFLASFNATMRFIIDQRLAGNVVESEDGKIIVREKKNGDMGTGKEVHGKPVSDRVPSEGANKIREGESGKAGGKHGDRKVTQEEEQEMENSSNEETTIELAKQRERDNPTLGKFKTTIRPLDGLAADDGRVRPTVQSRSFESNDHSTPRSNPLDGSTALLADAHYAKAIRMLSSPFDRTPNGGNALPHEVHAGEFDQAIEGKHGRGERFVKIDEPGGRRRRRRMVARRKKKLTKNNVDNGAPKMTREDIGGENDHHEEETIDIILDYIYDRYIDALDWISETLGIDLEVNGEIGDDSPADSVLSRVSGMSKHNEEDELGWKDTRVGGQLIWIYRTVVNMLWSRHKMANPSTLQKKPLTTSDSSSAQEEDDGVSLSKEDEVTREGLFNLEKAAELGHAEAQRMVANSLASGILPLSDHGLIQRLAEHQYRLLQGDAKNWTSILLQMTLQVPDDFSTGGQQLSRAIMLWHISAMSGNTESAMALGYRHLYSATGGSTLITDLIADENIISTGYHPTHGGAVHRNAGGGGGTGPGSHYGVLGTCPTAMAYYEAAANGVMDELEAGPTKGKVNPPIDEHRLAEIYTHGGSVALDSHNKPDELEEALQYYRMLASRSRYPEPDLVAAFTIANFYYNGYRGVRQDLRLALKYYETCGDYNHWEGGGQAGLMHLWGIGMTREERDLGKAYAYFAQGTPGGIDGCMERLQKRKRQNQKKEGSGGDEEVSLCDRNCINGMGLIHLLGVDGLVDRNVNMARRWFEHGKDLGDAESMYNYALVRLGWMVTELGDLPNDILVETSSSSSASLEDHNDAASAPGHKPTFDQNYMAYRSSKLSDVESKHENYVGPSASDFNVAIQDLTRAASKNHLQAKHKLGMLYASGMSVPKKRGRPAKVVTQSCPNALRYFKAVADGGHTVSRRNRAAWKQYNAGDCESALRNYLASAETGSEIGQVNAAFLLEQGTCLGLTQDACTRASVRLWRAAARQGNLEACLRVGDFYYYGRMKGSPGGLRARPAAKEEGETARVYDREGYLKSLEAGAFYFMPGPYRWARYVLYPEELYDLARKWASRSVVSVKKYVLAKLSDTPSGDGESKKDKPTDGVCDEAEGACSSPWVDGFVDGVDGADGDKENHMAIAAHYYRMAAEEHKSARANFNLGFMHEWGLGLAQDFPLAKRHYDLANDQDGGAGLASAIALQAMGLHQSIVKLAMNMKEYGEG